MGHLFVYLHLKGGIIKAMPTLDEQRKVRDLMIEGMQNQGITEAPCVEFTFKDGSVVAVQTDNHPALNRPAADVHGMKFRPSAEAGGVG